MKESLEFFITDNHIVKLFRGYHDKQLLKDTLSKYIDSDDFVVAFSKLRAYNNIKDLNGIKVVNYFSINELQEEIQSLDAPFVAYDFEKEYTPQEELNDAVNSVRRFSDIAKQNNKGMFLTITNIDNLTDTIKATVNYADYFVVQGQYFQDVSIGGGPDLYAEKVLGLVNEIRSVSSIPIIAQVSLIKGDLQNCKESYTKVMDYVDGIVLFYGYDTSISDIDNFYKYVTNL